MYKFIFLHLWRFKTKIYYCNNNILWFQLLKQFGKYEHEKIIPE